MLNILRDTKNNLKLKLEEKLSFSCFVDLKSSIPNFYDQGFYNHSYFC